MDENSSYKNIFKTTFLFGFVQVFNIVVKVILNKVVAVLLGAEGLGIIGIYNIVSKMIVTGAGLGINQSSVRDISEANAEGNTERFSRTISLVNKIIIFTSLLGIVVTLVLSPFLSKWTFGNNEYTIGFLWLSLVMYGSLVGMITAVPFYYFYGKGGIIPSLMITALAALFFSNSYVRKIEYKRIRLKLKETFNESNSMIKMGISLMLVGFMGTIFDMIVAAYISNHGSLADVGLYNAGTTIIGGYFGIIITAMSTDYYPRISSVFRNNDRLKDEMNKQSETGLIMVFPMVVLFVFLSPFFINVLYSSEFDATNQYTDYALIGTVIIIVSNCMGMILLAKQASNIFIWSVLGQRLILIIIYILGYAFYGLVGLGFAYIATGIVHISFMTVILRHYYSIRLSIRVYQLLLLVIITIIATKCTRSIDDNLTKYAIGSIIFVFSCVYSVYYMKKRMNIDIIGYFNSKI